MKAQLRRVGVVHALYADHQPWLLGRLRRRLNNDADAEDVSSETFVQVVAHPDPASIREPRAFLTTVAQRVLFHLWRRRDLEQAYLAWLSAQPETLAPSPEERALLLESLNQLAQALDGLPDKARRAFLYSQLDGLSYREIAERLGVSASSVRLYMAQGFARCAALQPALHR